MKLRNHAIALLLATTCATPLLAQAVQDADPEAGDPITNAYESTLKKDGVISKQIEINDTILLLERERERGDAINALVATLGYDAKVTLPDGEVLDLSTTKAGKLAKVQAMKEEQALLNESIALQQKRVEEELMTDPAVVRSMKLAREAELIEVLVEKIGPQGVITTTDGRQVDLSDTISGKRQVIEDLKVEADLVKAKAELAEQSNKMLQMEAERDLIASKRDLEKARLSQEARLVSQEENMPTAPQRQAKFPLTVMQIYGNANNLRANVLINDAQSDVGVGDQLNRGVRVKAIDATSVTLEANGQDQAFFIY